MSDQNYNPQPYPPQDPSQPQYQQPQQQYSQQAQQSQQSYQSPQYAQAQPNSYPATPQYAQTPQYGQQQYQQPQYSQPQYPQYQYGQQPYVNPQPADTGSFGWAVLGFFFPLVGLILYLVWRTEKPVSAKQAGMGALVSVIATVVLWILLIVFAAIIGSAVTY